MIQAGLGDFFGTMARNYQHGGFFMHPIALLMIIALAIAVERMYMLFVKLYVDGVGFMATIQKLVVSGKIGQAAKVCDYHRKAALARVVRAGLAVANQGEVALQNAIDEATLDVLPEINKRTSYLQMIANVATLLGLLGTIVGIITAFSGIANVDPIARQEMLGRGISEALNCTAFGLLLAIPSMIFHSILTARTLKMVDEIDRFSVKLINLLVRTFGRGATASGSGE